MTTYTFPTDEDEDGPWPIFRRILASHEELTELRNLMEMEVTIAFLLRFDPDGWRQGGRGILGKCYVPSVQGDLKTLFEQLLEDALGYFPDFLIVLNGLWWEGATDREREILLFHECLHPEHAKDQYGTPKFSRQTGRPVLGLRGHDLEEFNDVVRRYGAWAGDVKAFLDAAREHEERPNSPPRDLGAAVAAAVERMRDTLPEGVTVEVRPGGNLSRDLGPEDVF